MLFNEAMMAKWYAAQFQAFEAGAAKGHCDATWIVEVTKGVEMTKSALKRAFADTDKPLGWYFAGLLSTGREQFEWFQRSAVGGCSWAELHYADYFQYGPDGVVDVPVSPELYLEWTEKSARQNNPQALGCLGLHCIQHNQLEDGIVYLRRAAALGNIGAMQDLVIPLLNRRNAVDFYEAVQRAARGNARYEFWTLLDEIRTENIATI
jgi:TPR repeat protein